MLMVVVVQSTKGRFVPSSNSFAFSIVMILEIVIKGKIFETQVSQQMLESFECQHVLVAVFLEQLSNVEPSIWKRRFRRGNGSGGFGSS